MSKLAFVNHFRATHFEFQVVFARICINSDDDDHLTKCVIIDGQSNRSCYFWVLGITFFDTNLNFISLKNAKAIRFMIILSVHAIRLALTHQPCLAYAPELQNAFKQKGEHQIPNKSRQLDSFMFVLKTVYRIRFVCSVVIVIIRSFWLACG